MSNSPITRGIEHIGITVPDHDAAVRFLQDALDATVLYSLVPKGSEALGGEEITRQNSLDVKTAMRALSMLRLGNGPQLEIFELTGYHRQQAADMNDYGLTHFSLYVDDIESATARFEKAGGTLLAGPNRLTAQEQGTGNLGRFGRMPWGTIVEFISFPAGVRQDDGKPADRWKPAA